MSGGREGGSDPAGAGRAGSVSRSGRRIGLSATATARHSTVNVCSSTGTGVRNACLTAAIGGLPTVEFTYP